GYADTLTHALPIMTRHGAPFTVYVATGMMTGEIDAWWLGLAALIRARDRIDLTDLGLRFDFPDPRSKRRAFAAIESMVHRDYATLAHVKAAIAASESECGVLAKREGLTAEGLRRLASHPLVTIGAHGSTHVNLARVSAREVERELATNRRFLEAMTDRPVMHFAYPFGNANACGPREAGIVRSLGFHSASTPRRGALFPEHLAHLHALPREPLAG